MAEHLVGVTHDKAFLYPSFACFPHVTSWWTSVALRWDEPPPQPTLQQDVSQVASSWATARLCLFLPCFVLWQKHWYGRGRCNSRRLGNFLPLLMGEGVLSLN